MPHQKCAFTTGDHGITKEECQAEADAKKDAFYSWKKIDEGSDAVTNQCFTTATCVGALSNTANGWEVNYCTPADVANDKMCVTTSRGLACCSASCGTCSEDQCTDAPGGKDACCPETISQADKSCVTNMTSTKRPGEAPHLRSQPRVTSSRSDMMQTERGQRRAVLRKASLHQIVLQSLASFSKGVNNFHNIKTTRTISLTKS